MQIKNIILSLAAAAVAFVQAAPSPAAHSSVDTPVDTPDTTPDYTDIASSFDTCFAKSINCAPAGTDHLQVAQDCGRCLTWAVAECQESVCEGDAAELESPFQTCYGANVGECMWKLGYLPETGDSSLPVSLPVDLPTK